MGAISLLKDLSHKSDETEWILSRGGTKWDASHSPVKNAASLSLYPILNSMSIAGIIQIPGTMIGILLGKGDPIEAAKYQILLFILILVSSGFAILLNILLIVIIVFDDKHRFKSERILEKKKGSNDWVLVLFTFISSCLKWLLSSIYRCIYKLFNC